jgi:hypothetical protein
MKVLIYPITIQFLFIQNINYFNQIIANKYKQNEVFKIISVGLEGLGEQYQI